MTEPGKTFLTFVLALADGAPLHEVPRLMIGAEIGLVIAHRQPERADELRRAFEESYESREIIERELTRILSALVCVGQ